MYVWSICKWFCMISFYFICFFFLSRDSNDWAFSVMYVTDPVATHTHKFKKRTIRARAEEWERERESEKKYRKSVEISQILCVIGVVLTNAVIFSLSFCETGSFIIWKHITSVHVTSHKYSTFIYSIYQHHMLFKSHWKIATTTKKKVKTIIKWFAHTNGPQIKIIERRLVFDVENINSVERTKTECYDGERLFEEKTTKKWKRINANQFGCKSTMMMTKRKSMKRNETKQNKTQVVKSICTGTKWLWRRHAKPSHTHTYSFNNNNNIDDDDDD